jgi:hypothetical protein
MALLSRVAVFRKIYSRNKLESARYPGCLNLHALLDNLRA